MLSYDDEHLVEVDNVIKLTDDPNGNFGYPASVHLDDGSVWTVCYQVEKTGEKPCLMGTHWRID